MVALLKLMNEEYRISPPRSRGRALEELMDPSQRDLLQNQPFMQEKK